MTEDGSAPADDFRSSAASLIGWVENYNDHLREVIERCLDEDNPDKYLRRTVNVVHWRVEAIRKAVADIRHALETL